MAVYTTNLTIYTGTDFTQTFILGDDFGGLNLSGYSITMKMKKHEGSASSTSITTLITNAAIGRFRVSLTPAQTSPLKPGRYYYDIVLTKDGTNTRAIEGDVLVKKSVTRFD
tara:strand:+ start:313 stop:648 length:336 start_codon:yes stop_codon:yes gene_type:complete